MIRETMDTPVMPMSMEAEQGVLGGLLLDNRKWELVADLVTADMFSAESHADIFETIKSRIDAGEPADVLTVSESLDAAGGHRTIAYLAELAQNTPSAANIAFYARIVRDRSAQRRMVDAGMQVMEIASDLSIGSLDERMALAASVL
ncbi:DnaB-like helicase N-terminal domain-containing protein, partial [Laribacter hongkongensis]